MKNNVSSLFNEHRILVLGGGGTTGLRIEVESLIGLFGAETKGYDVLKKLGVKDVWCTSAGAIMGAGLAANFTLGEIRSMCGDIPFLQGIYAPRDKNAAKDEKKGDKHYFVEPESARKLSHFQKLKGIARDAIVAAYEIVLKAPYSAASKTNFLSNAMSHTLPPEHLSSRAIPALCDGKASGFGAGPMTGFFERTGVHFNIVCQDRRTRGTVVLTSRTDQPGQIEIDGEKISFVSGNKISAGEAVSASANPRPFFDEPVAGYDDGGMTGENCPCLLAAKMALCDGAKPKELKVMAMTVGPLAKDYTGPEARKNALMLYGSALFDAFLGDTVKKSVAGLAKILPNAEEQSVVFIPASKNKEDPFNHVTSMIQNAEDLKKLDSFERRFEMGSVVNLPVGDDEAGLSFKETLAKARRVFLLGPKEQPSAAFRNEKGRRLTLVKRRGTTARPS